MRRQESTASSGLVTRPYQYDVRCASVTIVSRRRTYANLTVASNEIETPNRRIVGNYDSEKDYRAHRF